MAYYGLDPSSLANLNCISPPASEAVFGLLAGAGDVLHSGADGLFGLPPSSTEGFAGFPDMPLMAPVGSLTRSAAAAAAAAAAVTPAVHMLGPGPVGSKKRGRPTVFQPLIDEGYMTTRKVIGSDADGETPLHVCLKCDGYARRTSYQCVAQHMLQCPNVRDPAVRARVQALLKLHQESAQRRRRRREDNGGGEDDVEDSDGMGGADWAGPMTSDDALEPHAADISTAGGGSVVSLAPGGVRGLSDVPVRQPTPNPLTEIYKRVNECASEIRTIRAELLQHLAHMYQRIDALESRVAASFGVVPHSRPLDSYGGTASNLV